ncbi:hypothetical protein MLD52_02750 [Puniceicoccaceae bacterium K14]|nr:hypothetical protein [Puniceicoccaceae bacterium K14]
MPGSQQIKHISGHIHPSDTNSKKSIFLKVDRRKLAKRRWRGEAENGEAFGFDLGHPLTDSDAFYEDETSIYRIRQEAEAVLKIPFSEMKQAAYYGWMIGNLHFSAAFDDDCVIAENDPAVRQMLERNHIPFEDTNRVFRPTIVSHGHSH